MFRKKFRVFAFLFVVISLVSFARRYAFDFYSNTALKLLSSASMANNNLSLSLYKQLNSDELSDGESLLFSPYSILLSLAMINKGAGYSSKTKEELVEIIGANDKGPSQNTLYRGLRQSQDLLARQGCEIHVANKIFVQENLSVLDSFSAALETYFGSEVGRVDFLNSERSAAEINGWVSQETRDKIDEIIAPKDITGTTRLVLVNAIYFNAEWEYQFDPNKTAPDLFYNDKQEPLLVDMMQQEKKFLHMENDFLEIVELPYKDSSLSMLVILPKVGVGLKTIEEQLSVDKLNKWARLLEEKKVLVRMPKFKIESSYSLKDPLSEMGIPNSFSSDADFSEITGKKGLFVDKILHKVFIEVGENGTEAAAATGVSMTLRSIGPVKDRPEIIFNADRPFIFGIFERNIGLIIFAGRAVSPVI